jgi:hypothetical protein
VDLAAEPDAAAALPPDATAGVHRRPAGVAVATTEHERRDGDLESTEHAWLDSKLRAIANRASSRAALGTSRPRA